MELKKGEIIIKNGEATYKGGSDKWSTYASYGTLYITNQRLVFEFTKSIIGNFLKRPKSGIEIPLAAIKNVQPGGKEIPLGFLVMRIDYSIKGESKFLLLTPIAFLRSYGTQPTNLFYIHRYGSRELVDDWIAQIRKTAKLPAIRKQKKGIISNINFG